MFRFLGIVVSAFFLMNFASPVVAQLADAVQNAISPIPDHLRLKTNPDHLVGTKVYPNGDVSYAYRTYEITNEPSPEVLRKAADQGLRITQEVLAKRTKHARVFATDKPNTYIAEIISGAPQYYRDGNGTWWQAEYGTTTKAMFDEQTKQNIISRLFSPQALAATTTTDFYPSTTVDGQLNREEATETATWQTLHDATSAPANDTATDVTIELRATANTDKWKQLIRGVFTFDTSSIGDTDTINSATLSLYGKLDQGDSFSVSHNIVEATPDSSTALTSTDYDNFSTTTVFSTAKTQASLSEAAYNNYDLNSNGLLNINKSGVSKFGVLIEADRQNVPPTWVGDGDSNYHYHSSEATGTSNDPKLTVVYSDTVPAPVLKVRKSSNQSVSNQTNISSNPDSQLSLTLSGNTTYILDGMIFASSTSAVPDLKIGFRYPVDAIADIGFIAASDSFRYAQLVQARETASDAIPLTANTPVVIHISGTIQMNGSGTTTLLWAQANSNSTPVTIIRGSYLRADAIQ